MVGFLKDLINGKSEDLSEDERNLLSVGFKNYIGAQRSAYRTVGAIQENKKYESYSEDCAAYKAEIAKELDNRCSEIIGMVKDTCLGKTSTDEAKVFYLKMIADYYRYISESASGDRNEEVKNQAKDFYEQAESAIGSLPAYNAIRLGLALNQSVFQYEVMNDKAKAIDLAQGALDAAKAHIEDMDNDDAREALSIVELLKENLDLWKEEEGPDNEVEDL